MFRQLPSDLSAQQARCPRLASCLDRQMPLDAQQACEGAEQGITFDELQAALNLSARGKKAGSNGLHHEFFSQFWDVLGPELLGVLQEAFQAEQGLSLPAFKTEGVITLPYIGKGLKALLDSYRPITLRNTDYKLLAKAPNTRFEPALQRVVNCVGQLDLFFLVFLGYRGIGTPFAVVFWRNILRQFVTSCKITVSELSCKLSELATASCPTT